LKFTLAAKVRRVTLVASEKNDVQRALKHALTFFSMTFSFGCRLTKPIWRLATVRITRGRMQSRKALALLYRQAGLICDLRVVPEKLPTG